MTKSVDRRMTRSMSKKLTEDQEADLSASIISRKSNDGIQVEITREDWSKFVGSPKRSTAKESLGKSALERRPEEESVLNRQIRSVD